ncbi:MAG: alpha/beta hydrolase [Planctomycetes bacterium]|nr:alpha/beta hydrolase [Planctomycetota bacterium]
MNFDTCLVVFSHGMASSPASSKIQMLSKIAEDKGAKTIAPDYTLSIDPKVRLEMLRDALKEQNYESLLFVGSSMGSYVSLKFAEVNPDKISAMFLMAPAVGVSDYGYPEIDVDNVKILHGWRDELIPAEKVFEYARKINAELALVDDGHRLSDSREIMQTLFTTMLDEL